MPKNTAIEIGFSFFDWPPLQSHNASIFVFVVQRLIFQYLGTCNIPLERTLKYLSNGILHDPKNYNYSQKMKKENMQLFSDCISGWSKEPQPTSAAVFLSIVFLLVKFMYLTTYQRHTTQVFFLALHHLLIPFNLIYKPIHSTSFHLLVL